MRREFVVSKKRESDDEAVREAYDELSGDVSVSMDGEEITFDPSTVIETAREAEKDEELASAYYSALCDLGKDSYNLATELNVEKSQREIVSPKHGVDVTIESYDVDHDQVLGFGEFVVATRRVMNQLDEDFGYFEEEFEI